MRTGSPGNLPLRSKVPRREGVQGEAGAMSRSLCETCSLVREIVTPKASRFLLCKLSQTDPDYPKYPPQPVVRCDGYRKKEQPRQAVEQYGKESDGDEASYVCDSCGFRG